MAELFWHTADLSRTEILEGTLVTASLNETSFANNISPFPDNLLFVFLDSAHKSFNETFTNF